MTQADPRVWGKTLPNAKQRISRCVKSRFKIDSPEANSLRRFGLWLTFCDSSKRNPWQSSNCVASSVIDAGESGSRFSDCVFGLDSWCADSVQFLSAISLLVRLKKAPPRPKSKQGSQGKFAPLKGLEFHSLE